ncbi:MAG: hypothetical protein CMH50_02605, partial [Myxococcales bacterium]|nr:hypothetical protein [Myxococcales bacterium]
GFEQIFAQRATERKNRANSWDVSRKRQLESVWLRMVVSRHQRLTGRSDDRSNHRSGVPRTR